jgi:hypothetical protein
MLDRQKQLYGRYPLKASFDGGFASKNNLKAKAKPRGSKMSVLPKSAVSKKPTCVAVSMCTAACVSSEQALSRASPG